MADGAKIKEAICAFANDYPRHGLPGVVFVGQNDDLTCSGLQIDGRLLETLGGWRSDGNILPFPSMAVQRASIDGCEIAAVIVEPSDNPPVRFNGRTWIRVGPRRAIATVAEEARLMERRQWLNLPRDALSTAWAEGRSDSPLVRRRGMRGSMVLAKAAISAVGSTAYPKFSIATFLAKVFLLR